MKTAKELLGTIKVGQYFKDIAMNEYYIVARTVVKQELGNFTYYTLNNIKTGNHFTIASKNIDEIFGETIDDLVLVDRPFNIQYI